MKLQTAVLFRVYVFVLAGLSSAFQSDQRRRHGVRLRTNAALWHSTYRALIGNSFEVVSWAEFGLRLQIMLRCSV